MCALTRRFVRLTYRSYWSSRRKSKGDIAGIHHVGLHVGDINRSVAFYCDLLGLVVTSRRTAEADYVADVVGYPNAVLHMAWLSQPWGGGFWS